MQLSDLLKTSDDFKVSENFDDVEIKGLSLDSRQCGEGFLFAALHGTNSDGTQFIDEVIKKGAKAILVSNGADVKEVKGAILIKHPNAREGLGRMAAKFYGNQPEVIAAVTGTNGKTSVVHFCRNIWKKLGKKSASIGTLGAIDSEGKNLTGESLTTPDVLKVHEMLEKLHDDEGINHVAIEASSHGLRQHRLAGVNLKIAAMTNITRDHLDYHKTFENYFSAKMRLFDRVMNEGIAVINADIEESANIENICLKRGHKIMTYGEKGEDIKLLGVEPSISGQDIKVFIEDKEYEITTELVGPFQVSNLLCAIGMVIASGFEVEKVVEACNGIVAVPGRMEKVAEHPSGALILVDYAHTPDALETVLKAARNHFGDKFEGKIKVVFGCGGDRDKGKRPLMGKVASKLADMVIVTDDNPRTENPEEIRKAVIEGCSGNYKEIGNRKEAIDFAVKNLEKGDILLIAGKGHEKVQIIGNERMPFDDVEIAKSIIKEVA